MFYFIAKTTGEKVWKDKSKLEKGNNKNQNETKVIVPQREKSVKPRAHFTIGKKKIVEPLANFMKKRQETLMTK